MTVHKSDFYFELKIPESDKMIAQWSSDDFSYQLLEGGILQFYANIGGPGFYIWDRGVRLPFILSKCGRRIRFKPTGKEVVVESIERGNAFGKEVPLSKTTINVGVIFGRHCPDLAQALHDD